MTPSSRRQLALKTDSAAATMPRGRPRRGGLRSASAPRPRGRRRPPRGRGSRRCRGRRRSVVGGKALALGLRDRGLAALDRVEADELGDAVVARGPGVDALLRLLRRLGGDLAADGFDEAVPEPRCGRPPPRRGGAARSARSRERSRRRRRRGGRGRRSRGGTARSSRRAPHGSARRRTSAGRRGARARSIAPGPARSAARRRCSNAVSSRGVRQLVGPRIRPAGAPERENIAAPDLPEGSSG